MTDPSRPSRASAKDQLFDMNNCARDVIEKTFQDHQDRIGRLLQLDIDIQEWKRVLTDRPEIQQIHEAQVSLAHAIYAAVAGQYRHAYSGLRLFLELSFAAVYFSANELARRRWISDRQDFSWSRALDEADGILSKSFVQEFNPDAAHCAERYAKDAASSYRACSQFLHGKDVATRNLPSSIEYSSTAFIAWSAAARTSAECVLFLIFCRYGDNETMSDSKIVTTIQHSFSHLTFVRERLGMPVEKDLH